MAKNGMNPKVDVYLRKAKTWQPEIKALRAIVLGCGLTEELKWGKPCYMFEKSNVVIFIPLKGHLALAFTKGALLKDSKGVLSKIGNSQAGRWIKFAGVREISKLKPILKSYIREAVEAEKAGLKVRFKETSEYEVPEELQKKLKADSALKKAFNALTPGRQRGYLVYFSSAKQSKTRESRIEKCRKQILSGKGLHD